MHESARGRTRNVRGTPIQISIARKAREISVFNLTNWRAATSVWCVLRSGHPGLRRPAPLANSSRDAFQRDYRFSIFKMSISGITSNYRIGERKRKSRGKIVRTPADGESFNG